MTHKVTWKPRAGASLSDIEAVIGYDSGGWHVVWCQEDEHTRAGYRVCYWYGTREECEARLTEPPPPVLVEPD